MSRRALAALVISLAVGCLASPASASSASALRTKEWHLVRTVERAKTTLRWFEKHPRILYSHNPKVKRRAWHIVAVARQQIILGRVALTRIRAQLVAIPVIPHLREWLCIHRFEAGWRGTDNATHNTYFGGLQFDRGFMRDYGADMLRKYGGRYANHWTPRDQMIVAERGWRDRGFSPWPRTARYCGLL